MWLLPIPVGAHRMMLLYPEDMADSMSRIIFFCDSLGVNFCGKLSRIDPVAPFSSLPSPPRLLSVPVSYKEQCHGLNCTPPQGGVPLVPMPASNTGRGEALRALAQRLGKMCAHLGGPDLAGRQHGPYGVHRFCGTVQRVCPFRIRPYLLDPSLSLTGQRIRRGDPSRTCV